MLIASALVLSGVAVAPAASAQTASSAAQPRAPFVEVRLALSTAAVERFTQQRFRRLLAIELEEIGHLAPQSSGPLADHVAYVWIDTPGRDQVAIQVRSGARPISRRSIAVRNMRADVAERLIAIATAEMVRAQSRPERPRKLVCPKEHNAHDDTLPGEMRLGLVWSGELTSAWQPSSAAFLAGPGGAVGFLSGPLEQHVYARWLVGDSGAAPMRWLEAGVGVHHLLLSRSAWRLSLGGAGGASVVHLVGARSVAGTDGEDAWTARAAARALAERRLGQTAWLGLSLEPGAILRRVPFAYPSGDSGSLEGLWLGLSVSLAVEHGLPRNGAHAR